MYDIIETRMQQGAQLSEVWDQVEASTDGHLDTMMSWLRQMGTTLGDETVLLVTAQSAEDDDLDAAPIVLSEVNAAAFMSGFDAGLAELRQQVGASEEQFDLRIIDSPVDAVDDELSIWLHGDLLVASTHADGIRQIADIVEGRTQSGVGSAFHGLLESAYSEGAEFLGGLNVEQVLVSMSVSEQELSAAGIDNVRYLIAHRSQAEGLASLDATLYFEGARQGVASWLSDPSPMGSLEFFSVDSTLAAAITTKDLTHIFAESRDIADALAAQNGDLATRDMTPEMRGIVDELATSLGSQVAIGIDGPALPVPAWKIVAEVYDSITLQHRIETMVAELNQRAMDEGRDAVLVMTSSPVGGYEGWRVSAATGAGVGAGNAIEPLGDLLTDRKSVV